MRRLRALWLRPPTEGSDANATSLAPATVVSPTQVGPPPATAASAAEEESEDVQAEAPAEIDGAGVPWEPPKSPFGLLQETYHKDPWRLLVISILLNVTNGKHQVRPVIGALFDKYPSPEAMSEADEAELAGMIRGLGLYRKRAKALVEFSRTYLDAPPWRTPAELKYFGKYADDSYRLFCLGEWREVRPRDKKLKQYRDWLLAHYGAKKSESELEGEHEWAEKEKRRKQRMKEKRQQRKRKRTQIVPEEGEEEEEKEDDQEDEEDDDEQEEEEEEEGALIELDYTNCETRSAVSINSSGERHPEPERDTDARPLRQRRRGRRRKHPRGLTEDHPPEEANAVVGEAALVEL